MIGEQHLVQLLPDRHTTMMQDEDPTSDSELDKEEEEDAKPARKRTKTSFPGTMSSRHFADKGMHTDHS